MNNQKICFIICANNEFLAEECKLYIEQLALPEAFEKEVQIIYGAQSMTSGYNQAMKQSDAKYKVYLHQDVLLIYREMLIDMVSFFTSHPEVGMLGVVGNKGIEEDGCPWSGDVEHRVGEVYSDQVTGYIDRTFGKITGEYQKVVVIDGLLMMTQYDVPWREDLFTGWDFYDCSQALEFWKAGYQVAVPKIKQPWCLHDNDIQNMTHYDKWRNVFYKEYFKYYKHWNEQTGAFDCDLEKIKNQKNAVIQHFYTDQTRMKFPYPPVYKEENVDYICIADDPGVHSKFWKMVYSDDPNLTERYENVYELRQDQIQVGPVFSECEGYDPVVTIPKLSELPEVTFQPKNITLTADVSGRYIYKKNNVDQGGKYDGRPLLLTIGVPVSNQIETIDRCLSHIKPLLDNLPSELLVIDTGSTDGTIEVCRKYGARVIEHPWCDNMSLVRNLLINHARGEWYLSIDDDEWFESVDGILSFFQKGMYKTVDTATYIQRNYYDHTGRTYGDNHTLRMARITPDLHFEGRIHDSLIVPKTSRNCMLYDYAHHYGFARDDEKRTREKYKRNVSILLQDIYEYPSHARYNYQLANELKCQEFINESVAFFIRGISMAEELQDDYYGRYQVVNLLSGLCELMDERYFPYVELLKDRYKLMYSEHAFLNYYLASLGIHFHMEPEKILGYCEEYERYLKKFQMDPYDSQLRTCIGLHVCDNELYIKDEVVMMFCAYSRLGQIEKALDQLDKISVEEIYGQKYSFFETTWDSELPVWQAVCQKIWGQMEIYLEYLMDAFLAGICREEIQEKLLARLPDVLSGLSIQGIQGYLWKNMKEMLEPMKKVMEQHAMAVKPENCCVQEQYFNMEILKQCIFENRDEIDLDRFIQYICMAGGYAQGYYKPEILQQADSYAISLDIRAAYEIYQAMLHWDDQKQFVQGLRNALQIFPGFKKEIQALTEVYLKQ